MKTIKYSVYTTTLYKGEWSNKHHIFAADEFDKAEKYAFDLANFIIDNFEIANDDIDICIPCNIELIVYYEKNGIVFHYVHTSYISDYLKKRIIERDKRIMLAETAPKIIENLANTIAEILSHNVRQSVKYDEAQDGFIMYEPDDYEGTSVFLGTVNTPYNELLICALKYDTNMM